MSDGDSLEILGYYTAGDGGGGTFYWDATSTATDNGGTIIQATGVTTGRWIRAYSGAINVKWFGVKGDSDGTTGNGTDDTVVLQAIFSAIHTSKFYSIFMPQGKYRITSTLTVPNAPVGSAIDSSFKLEGESLRGTLIVADGAETAIELGETARTTAYTQDDTHSGYISNMSFSGIGSNYAIRCEWRYNRTTIDNCYAYGFDKAAFAQDREISDVLYVSDSKAWGLSLNNCKAKFNAIGFLISSHQTSMNNCLGALNDYGTVIQRGISVDLNDCDMEANATYEIEVRDASNLNIRGLYCETGYNSTYSIPGEGSKAVTPHPAINIAPTVLISGLNINNCWFKTNNIITSMIQVDTSSFSVYALTISNNLFGVSSTITADYIVDITGTSLFKSSYLSNYAANGAFTSGAVSYVNGFSFLDDTFGGAGNSGTFKTTPSFINLGVTGFSDISTVNVRVAQHGNIISLDIIDLTITGTSNASTFTLTGLPASLRPTTNHKLVSGLWASDNGNNRDDCRAVSYTHLTLPTILRV
jgi:hypothetical protein